VIHKDTQLWQVSLFKNDIGYRPSSCEVHWLSTGKMWALWCKRTVSRYGTVVCINMQVKLGHPYAEFTCCYRSTHNLFANPAHIAEMRNEHRILVRKLEGNFGNRSVHGKITLEWIFLIYIVISLRIGLPSGLCVQVFRLKFCMHFLTLPACYMSCPSPPLWFDDPNSVWWAHSLRNLIHPLVPYH